MGLTLMYCFFFYWLIKRFLVNYYRNLRGYLVKNMLFHYRISFKIGYPFYFNYFFDDLRKPNVK